MSFDAGGLAQMNFNPNNNFSPTGGIGLPGSGFASRGKGTHIKRLSVAPSANIGSISENEADGNPAPRTSRSHLLAGLRTAPKISTNVGSASAPYSQTQFNNPSRGAGGGFQSARPLPVPMNQQQNINSSSQLYSGPSQVLAPPSFTYSSGDANGMDQQAYNHMMATNMYLAQRQQQLQQQLINVQAAAQQFQGMNLNGQQQYNGSPVSPQTSYYSQQVQNGMQPIIQPVPNQPGIYSVYNPMTGQHSYYPDPNTQFNNLPHSPPASAPDSGPDMENPFSPRERSSPQSAAAAGWTRTFSPPRQSPSPPQDVTPLPEPSANAYRPGHRKSVSSVAHKSISLDASKASGLRSAGGPQTPINGTFGLGHGRAGEHPTRQPRGPPPLEELIASPTAKHEGSKNFATRQRRRAVFSLVRAGAERRSGRPLSANEDGVLPNQDSDTSASLSLDADSAGTPAGDLSATSSMGSLKAAAGAAIGFEIKHMKERSRDRDSFARRLTDSSNTSDEGPASVGAPGERKKTPMLVLTSAEKRKTPFTGFSAITN